MKSNNLSNSKMLNFKRIVLSATFGIVQFALMTTMPTSIAKAQDPCATLESDSLPSEQSREIRSSTNLFEFKIPANYRAVEDNQSILIFSPEGYNFYQCKLPTSLFFTSTQIWVSPSELPSSASLRQVFDLKVMKGERIEGTVEEIRVSGEPGLRYHAEIGGDGLTRNYIFYLPQRTKTITISTWIGSVNSPDPEVFSRIVNSLQILFSATETTPRIGILPTLDVCGLAVWQRPGDNLTHLLMARGGDSFAGMRIDDRLVRLRPSGNTINPQQTNRPPSRYVFQNRDRSITATLQGTWQFESGWVLARGNLTVTEGENATELPVSASLGCNFLFY